jgi:hypothetical protein
VCFIKEYILIRHQYQTIFTHHVYDIDVPEKEADVSKEMDTTTEESCNSTAADNAASPEDGEPLTKRKRKPKHFNKPLTQEVCRWEIRVENTRDTEEIDFVLVIKICN